LEGLSVGNAIVVSEIKARDRATGKTSLKIDAAPLTLID
jgi:hypothetical protein